MGRERSDDALASANGHAHIRERKQKLAIFENVRIPPNRKHALSYTATDGISAVGFLLPELPLSELKKIPKEIAYVDKVTDSNDIRNTVTLTVAETTP